MRSAELTSLNVQPCRYPLSPSHDPSLVYRPPQEGIHQQDHSCEQYILKHAKFALCPYAGEAQSSGDSPSQGTSPADAYSMHDDNLWRGRTIALAASQRAAQVCSPGGVDRASAPACPLGPPPTLVAGPWAARKAHHSLGTADLAALHGICTSSHLLPLEPESSKAVTLKSASLSALHAVDSSCSPSAQAHLQRLLKQQAPHCPQLW